MKAISLLYAGVVMMTGATVLQCALALNPAHGAQSYPVKPIRIIVPFPPGGSNDIVARYFGQKLTQRLGQQTVIDNRAGADAIIGTQLAAAAPPDGYTLLVVSTTFAMTPATHRKLPYDPLTSLAPVTLIGSGPMMLGSFPGLPVSSLKELIAMAKAKPGALHYASSSIGGVTHFAGELFNLMAGVNIVHVAYKGGAPAITDVMAGHVQLLFNTLGPVLPQIRSGRLKILGVGSAKRTAALPDAPTIAESGVPGYEASIWWGMLAPAGTPRAIVNKLNAEVGVIMREPETVKWFTALAADPWPSTPEDFGKWLGTDIARWRKVAKEAGIRLQ